MKTNKGFVNIVLVIALLVLISAVGYLLLNKKDFSTGVVFTCPVGTKLETVCLNSWPTKCSNYCSDGSKPLISTQRQINNPDLIPPNSKSTK